MGPGGRHAAEHCPGGAADPGQAPGAGDQLPAAPALEFPPADAGPEHGLLRRRVRRPHHHQDHADRAGRARHDLHHHRHRGRHDGLPDHHDGARCQLRHLAAAAAVALDRGLYRGLLLVRAPARRRGQGPGRRALADDRAHHRCLYQHRHRQAIRPHAPRSRLRALGHGSVPRHRQCPDAAGEPV
ncbi:hypothetical protein D3C78_1292860 [compost metagenome]